MAKLRGEAKVTLLRACSPLSHISERALSLIRSVNVLMVRVLTRLQGVNVATLAGLLDKLQW